MIYIIYAMCNAHKVVNCSTYVHASIKKTRNVIKQDIIIRYSKRSNRGY